MANIREVSTYHILHVHTAPVAKLLNDMGSGVLPVRAELDLCAWSWPFSTGPRGLVPSCTTTLCAAARDQPWGGMSQRRDSPPTGPSSPAAALGPAHSCRAVGCCGRLSWWGGGLHPREM